jgi:signal peptidase I
MQKNSIKKNLKKQVNSWFWAIFIIFAFRSTFFEPYRIPTGSMIPSIMIGDFILVNKLSYGIKVPFSEYTSKPRFLYKFNGPQVDDIVVFKYPKNPNISFVKRVVGMPGDKIDIIGTKLLINGVVKKFNKISYTESSAIVSELEDKFKKFPLSVQEGSGFKIIFNKKNPHKINKTFFVPDKKYFVMGDNRDFSSDSRSWGFVPEENIKGKAMFVWFSYRLPFLGDSGNSSRFKWWRIGTGL